MTKYEFFTLIEINMTNNICVKYADIFLKQIMSWPIGGYLARANIIANIVNRLDYEN